MQTIHCSSLPRIRRCTASATAPAIDIGGNSPEANLGTAAHHGLRRMVDGIDINEEELISIYDVERGPLGVLLALGRRHWGQLRDFYPNTRTEVEMEAGLPPGDSGAILTGTADVLALVEDMAEVRILDWKAGVDRDHGQQLRGYAWLALEAHPWAETAHVAVVNILGQTVDRERFTRAEMDAWAALLVRDLTRAPQYNPGEACRYCPHGATCHAKTAMLREAAQSVMSAEHFFESLPDDLEERGAILARLLENCKWIVKHATDASDLIKADVQAHGGRLPDGNGGELAITSQVQKHIDPSGLPVLREYLSEDEINEALTVGKGKVEAALGLKAPPRGKGKLIKSVMERLEAQEALVPKTIEKLERRRVALPVTQETVT